MTTQNVNQDRLVFPVGTASGTYYGPCATGAAAVAGWSAATGSAYVEMDGYDHLSFQGTITAVGAATATLTIESDDGVTNTYVWDETLGSYESTTNAFAASYVGSGGNITPFHLHLNDCDGKRFHVKLVTTDNTAVCDVTWRRTKV